MLPRAISAAAAAARAVCRRGNLSGARPTPSSQPRVLYVTYPARAECRTPYFAAFCTAAAEAPAPLPDKLARSKSRIASAKVSAPESTIVDEPPAQLPAKLRPSKPRRASAKAQATKSKNKRKASATGAGEASSTGKRSAGTADDEILTRSPSKDAAVKTSRKWKPSAKVGDESKRKRRKLTTKVVAEATHRRKSKNKSRKRESKRNSEIFMYERSKWTGMTEVRRRRIPFVVSQSLKSLPELQDIALDSAFGSALRSSHEPVQQAMRVFEAAKVHRSCSPPFKPSDETMVALVEATMQGVEKRPDLLKLSANGADVACETLFRSMEMFQARASIPALIAVLRSAERDPIVERRAERALSVFRFLRGLQMPPTAEFVYACFRACVSGLDVAASAVIMEFALGSGMYADIKGDGPLQIDYYDGVMYAALLMGDFNTTVTAHNEVLRRELQPTPLTDSIYLALCLERGDDVAARILLGALQKKGLELADCVFAAMLRAAGRRKEAEAVRGIFRDFEQQQGREPGRLARRLSALFAPYQGVNGMLSARASAAAKADPAFAVFQALRTCGAAEEAVEQLAYLRREYGFRPGKAVFALVIETCWRAGRLDLAQRMRNEMEAALAVEGRKTKRRA